MEEYDVPIYRALKKIDEVKVDVSPNATVRIEIPSGDQTQFDWSNHKGVFSGGSDYPFT